MTLEDVKKIKGAVDKKTGYRVTRKPFEKFGERNGNNSSRNLFLRGLSTVLLVLNLNVYITIY